MPVCEDLYTKTKPLNWEIKIQSKIWIKLDKLDKLLEFCKWHSLMIINPFIKYCVSRGTTGASQFYEILRCKNQTDLIDQE